MPVYAIVVVTSFALEGKWDVSFIQLPIYATRRASSLECFAHFDSPDATVILLLNYSCEVGIVGRVFFFDC